MKKSTLIMILSLVLAVALGVGGTLAYLTDEDGDINVMTVGHVTITQNEQERVEIGNPDAGLDEFTQNKPMNPAVIDSGTKETVNVNGWDVGIRKEVKNYIDKIVSVTNTGSTDAYVRTIYAIPEAGDFYVGDPSNASEQWLHWNGVSDGITNPKNGWFWGTEESGLEWPGNEAGWNFYDDIFMEVNGAYGYYDIFIATNVNPLKPGETTAPSLTGLYLDPRVDCDVNPATGEKNYTFVTSDGTKYNLGDISTLNVLALSQAVQADGFDTAWEAFEAAFPIPEEIDNPYDNIFVDWFNGLVPGTPGDKWPSNNPPVIPETAVLVTNWDELKAAFDAGEKDIYLDKGIYRVNNVGADTAYSIPEGTHLFGIGDVMIEGRLGGTLKDVVVENIKFSANYAIYQASTSGTVCFKNCYFDGYGTYAVNFASTNADVDFEDCVIRGWASMASGTGSLDFTDCEFIGNNTFCLLRPFIDTTLNGCSFDTTKTDATDIYPEGIEAAGCTITLNGCTNVNGAIEDLLVSTGDGGYVVQ